ncbi:LysR family transcriptional regulator [Paenibacillus filicis]|uniref:LysR family transcriptional regulator n=1 Tax=Paenibacillus filicis TaxID=669464 RepID=A0ABU9DFZ6_9BACL
MELRTIKTFQTIVRLGSFQQAAEVLLYSQPTITMHIKKLESDLGVKLLKRDSKKIQLTEAGRIFHQRADLLLREHEALSSTLTDLAQGEAGLVRIGVSEPTASNRIPGILSSFRERNPKIQVSVHIGDPKRLHRLLVDEMIDFAVCAFPQTTVDTVFEPLLVEEMALLLYDTHPLSSRKEVKLQELRSESFLLTSASCPIRIWIDLALTEKLGGAYTGTEINNINSHKYFVQSKLGISIVPVVTTLHPVAGTLVKTIADLKEGPEVGILTKRHASLGLASEKMIQQIKTMTRGTPIRTKMA